MKEFNKIMAAIDLSDYSSEVLEYAGIFCKQTGAELVIVNVINQRELDAIKTVQLFVDGKSSVDEVVQRQKAERNEKIRLLIESCGLQELPSKIVFRTGRPYEELIQAAKEEKVQMVIMGPKGRGNVPGLLFGTSAEKMFRHCPVPLLSTRGEGLSRF